MSEGLYKVVDAINAIGAAARSATDDLQAAVSAQQAAASGGGGDNTSGITTGGKGSGLSWVSASVTAAGSMENGNLIMELKSQGGRT